MTNTTHLFSILFMTALFSNFAVQRARNLLRPAEATGGLLDLPRVLGRVVEVSEAGFFGAVTVLCGLMLQVQVRLEQIAWVETGTSVFFPPDLAFRGLDVEAITVVLTPEAKAGLQAADLLLRSGAFGLIVIDWVGSTVDEATLGRLARMAEDRQTAVIFLTRKRSDVASLGTQVSLRGVVSLTPLGETQWQVIRDKQSGPLSQDKAQFYGPFGLY